MSNQDSNITINPKIIKGLIVTASPLPGVIVGTLSRIICGSDFVGFMVGAISVIIAVAYSVIVCFDMEVD